MEDGEASERVREEDFSSSIPRGGPIFVADLVSRLTRVPVFESQVFHELECLKAELGSGLLDFEEDISVDELKLRTDEDLVIEALKIAFDGDEEAGTSDKPGNLCSSGLVGTEDDQRMSDPDTPASCESSDGLESTIANLKKRKRNAEKKPKSKNKRLSTMNASKKDKPVDVLFLVLLSYFVFHTLATVSTFLFSSPLFLLL